MSSFEKVLDFHNGYESFISSNYSRGSFESELINSNYFITRCILMFESICRQKELREIDGYSLYEYVNSLVADRLNSKISSRKFSERILSKEEIIVQHDTYSKLVNEATDNTCKLIECRRASKVLNNYDELLYIVNLAISRNTLLGDLLEESILLFSNNLEDMQRSYRNLQNVAGRAISTEIMKNVRKRFDT